jgi:arylsulfatase
VLPRPELYNLANDPDESYDVAQENAEVVTRMRAQIEEMLKGFPEPVQKAYAEAEARKAAPETPAGAYPRPIGQ